MPDVNSTKANPGSREGAGPLPEDPRRGPSPVVFDNDPIGQNRCKALADPSLDHHDADADLVQCPRAFGSRHAGVERDDDAPGVPDPEEHLDPDRAVRQQRGHGHAGRDPGAPEHGCKRLRTLKDLLTGSPPIVGMDERPRRRVQQQIGEPRTFHPT